MPDGKQVKIYRSLADTLNETSTGIFAVGTTQGTYPVFYFGPIKLLKPSITSADIPKISRKEARAAPTLPSGWTQETAPDGKTYYWYEDLKLTQWEFPVLPPGWTEEISTHKNSEGKIFYWHPDTNKVQWNWPVLSGGRRKHQTRRRKATARRSKKARK
jgi:hypothetical protein